MYNKGELLSTASSEISGCRLVDEVVWVKMTVNRRMAKSHGYYLQHAKEVCLIAKKGSDPSGTCHSTASDIIYSERRGQSQKPEEIYQLVERLVPGGMSAVINQEACYITYICNNTNSMILVC